MSPIERKNGWQMAEATGESTPYALQQFLYRGQFSADNLRDHLRNYVNEKLEDEDGILVVDETGFLKHGKDANKNQLEVSLKICRLKVGRKLKSAPETARISNRFLLGLKQAAAMDQKAHEYTIGWFFQ